MAQALPNDCCVLPPSHQKDRYTLIERSQILLKQSVTTVRGKILEGENFGEFGEQLAIRQNFPHQYL